MNSTSRKCPHCGLTLKNTIESDVFFCNHCERYIMLDDFIESAESKKQYDENQASWERNELSKHYHFARHIIIAACICVVFFLVFGSAFIKSSIEERNLRQTVNSIMVDIEHENFSSARIKTNSLYYTSDWSEDIKEKWDNTREQLLEEIDKAEAASAKQHLLNIVGDADKSETKHGFTNN